MRCAYFHFQYFNNFRARKVFLLFGNNILRLKDHVAQSE